MDAFLAAVQRASGGDVAALEPFVPATPTAAVDAVLCGTPGAGRTVELFSTAAAPLAALACLAAELRAGVLNEALDAPLHEILRRDIGAQLASMPVLGAQLAEALADPLRAPLTPHLEALAQQLARGGAGATPAHAALLHAYLSQQRHADAQRLVERTDLAATDVTQFANAAGLLPLVYGMAGVHMASRAWGAALDAYATCVAMPADGVHPLQQAAFQRLVLVHLLRDGRLPPVEQLAPLCSHALRMQYMRECRPYVDFAHAYARAAERAADAEHDALGADAPRFAQDGTADIMAQCIAQLRQRRIETLARVYSTVFLEHLAAFIGARVDETRAELDALVRGRSLWTDGRRRAARCAPRSAQAASQCSLRCRCPAATCCRRPPATRCASRMRRSRLTRCARSCVRRSPTKSARPCRCAARASTLARRASCLSECSR